MVRGRGVWGGKKGKEGREGGGGGGGGGGGEEEEERQGKGLTMKGEGAWVGK